MADEKLPRPETWAVLTKDQYLKYLGDLEDIDFEYYRQMFISHMINLQLNIGSINPETSHLVPGIASPLTGTDYTDGLTQSVTMTCPANRRRRVYYAAAVNQTQVSTVSLTSSTSGDRTLALSSLSSQTVWNPVIGGDLASIGGDVTLKEYWLEPGETLTLTLTTHAGGNDTHHIFKYEEYRC